MIRLMWYINVSPLNELGNIFFMVKLYRSADSVKKFWPKSLINRLYAVKPFCLSLTGSSSTGALIMPSLWVFTEPSGLKRFGSTLGRGVVTDAVVIGFVVVVGGSTNLSMMTFKWKIMKVANRGC